MDQISPKMVFPVKNRKSESHHGILHIQISLGTKFQFKLTSLILWTKLTQKRYFRWRTGKVNNIEFCIFDLD